MFEVVTWIHWFIRKRQVHDIFLARFLKKNQIFRDVPTNVKRDTLADKLLLRNIGKGEEQKNKGFIWNIFFSIASRVWEKIVFVRKTIFYLPIFDNHTLENPSEIK